MYLNLKKLYEIAHKLLNGSFKHDNILIERLQF